jgi:hypothetical protein
MENSVQLEAEPAHSTYKATHIIYINNSLYYVTYCLVKQVLEMTSYN